MKDEPITADVREFILRHIDSVAQLEALLLMKHNPGERWNAAKMASRIYTSESETAELLARLRADGFLSSADDFYWYECKNPDEQETVDRLSLIYSRHLIPVTNLIHAKPRRIRQFADAFKFRKDR
jgi:hypothetical protein